MGEAWTESQEGISIFFFSFSFLLAVVLVLSVSDVVRALMVVFLSFLAHFQPLRLYRNSLMTPK